MAKNQTFLAREVNKMPLIAQRKGERVRLGRSIRMTNLEREIAHIAKDQLSHDTDLPPARMITINGKRIRVKEIPVDPNAFNVLAYFQSGMKHNGRTMMNVTPFHHKTYLPPAERTYVDGRDWTIGA